MTTLQRTVTVFIGTYMDCVNHATATGLTPVEFVIISVWGDLDRLRDVTVRDVVLVGPPFPSRASLERNVRALSAESQEPVHVTPPERTIDLPPQTSPERADGGSPPELLVDPSPKPSRLLSPREDRTAPDAGEQVRPAGDVGDGDHTEG